MFDTNIAVIGNVLTAPEWRKTSNSGHLVANFRVASTSRRLDRETGRWVDGNSLRVRVVCWRKLAEGIAASLAVGDPVVVTGKLYTRDWTDSENNARTTYEMEAVAVGHDLSRGRGRFYRNRAQVTSVVETDGQARGESADLVGEAEAPIGYGDGVPDGEAPTLDEGTARAGEGFEPFDKQASEEPGGFDPLDDELEIAVEAVARESAPTSRRSSRRQPVAA
ncbi:MAG: single-strand DNA-binding protein [Actinoplanes sp.]|nr:single-strand DNA-binding protein [Actinoplanes sp.]